MKSNTFFETATIFAKRNCSKRLVWITLTALQMEILGFHVEECSFQSACFWDIFYVNWRLYAILVVFCYSRNIHYSKLGRHLTVHPRNFYKGIFVSSLFFPHSLISNKYIRRINIWILLRMHAFIFKAMNKIYSDKYTSTRKLTLPCQLRWFGMMGNKFYGLISNRNR